MSSIFLSYSSRDREFAAKLAKAFRQRGVSVWWDAWEMRAGDSLTQKIQDAISQSSFFVAVLSPHSVNSSWVKVELRTALSAEISTNRLVVLPALIADCEIPPFLIDKVYADFRLDFSRGFEELLFAIGAAHRAVPDDDILELMSDALIMEKLTRMDADQIARLVSGLEVKWGVSAGYGQGAMPGATAVRQRKNALARTPGKK